MDRRYLCYRSIAEWRKIMRSFIAACLVVVGIAAAAALILDNIVQESAAAKFSTSAVRL